MEYCKHCSKPILSGIEYQIYCSSECWRESKSGSKVEVSETDIEKKSTLYVWSSIISMFIGLFLLLMLTATVVNSEEVFLPLFTISAGVLVLVVLQNILPKEEIKGLLSFENNVDTWKLIGWVLLLEVFDIMPLHAAITLLENSYQLTQDTEGRILLPKELRKYACLSDEAVFVGRGTRFQIWQPAAYHIHNKNAFERVRHQAATLRLKKPVGGLDQ